MHPSGPNPIFPDPRRPRKEPRRLIRLSFRICRDSNHHVWRDNYVAEPDCH